MVRARNAAFEFSGESGSYSELALEAAYRPFAWAVIGAFLPMEFLRLASGMRTGPGDPSGYFELPWEPARGHLFAVGSRISLPLGSRADGLGSGHAVYSPYFSWGGLRGPYHAGLLVGATLSEAKSAGDHAHHGEGMHHPVLYIHPHGNREILFRASLGRAMARGRTVPTLSLLGQSVLQDRAGHAPGKRFLVVGISSPVYLRRMSLLSLLPALEMPVSPDRRQDWQFSLGMGHSW